MADSVFPANALTGGGAGSLDDINHTAIVDGDVALVAVAANKYFYVYTYDANSATAQSSPDVIKPVSNSGNGRWLLTYMQSYDAFYRDAARATTLGEFFAGIDVEYEHIFIPAGAMTELTTNGATLGTYEYPTNDLSRKYMAFAKAQEEYVTFNLVMPDTWDRSTIKFKAWWSSDTGSTTAETVEWELAAGAFSDGDALDAALGTGQVISDALLADNGTDGQWSEASPAITVGGTPAVGDEIVFKLSRNISGTDDMTEDAWLFGILIEIKHSNSVSAW